MVRIKESGSFLKKRTKKLLLLWAWGVGAAKAHAPESKNFFASFFMKKEALPALAF
jgi:hypothetical protein